MASLRRLFAFPIALLVACGGTDDQGVVPAPGTRLVVSALAGPVCPVETDPPSPECAPWPVASAVIAVTTLDGMEVARGVTGPDGKVGFDDLSPGELAVVPQPVAGLPGTAAMVAVTMTPGQTLQVTAMYDTGIR